MSIVVRFNPSGLTTAKYEEVSRRCQETLDWPPQGMDMHVCFGTEGDLKVSEIWDSREQFEAFSEHLRPLLVDAGVDIAAPPEIYEIHTLQKREPSIS